jgi:ssDNA-binding Zn-finger/Zn-ribbon topoisomerase 1
MSFQCPVCGKGFSKVNRLKQHFKMFHDGDTCPICNTRHNVIANHFRQVNDPKHHLCYFLKVRRFRCNPTIRLEALKMLRGGVG